MTASDRLQNWLDKLALTELLSILSAAVDRGDRDTIIDATPPTPTTTTVPSKDPVESSAR